MFRVPFHTHKLFPSPRCFNSNRPVPLALGHKSLSSSRRSIARRARIIHPEIKGLKGHRNPPLLFPRTPPAFPSGIMSAYLLSVPMASSMRNSYILNSPAQQSQLTAMINRITFHLSLQLNRFFSRVKFCHGTHKQQALNMISVCICFRGFVKSWCCHRFNCPVFERGRNTGVAESMPRSPNVDSRKHNVNGFYTYPRHPDFRQK